MNRIRTSSGRARAPRTRRRLGVATALLFAVSGAGCQLFTNHPDPLGPRSAGAPPPTAATVDPADDDVLVIATFNVKHGKRVERAIQALRADSVTRDADILLLQEMDAAGTRRVAESFGMGWVYYPARDDRDGDGVGNAILSRWPILDDEKVVLPHLALFGGSQRIATAATIRVGSLPIRVYSVHLATPANLGPGKRRDQLGTVLEDAAGHPRVVIGGDLNSHGLGEMAVDRGFAWPTRDGPATVSVFRWDHIFHRGLDPVLAGAGTVLDTRGASDHRPVWVRLILSPAAASAGAR